MYAFLHGGCEEKTLIPIGSTLVYNQNFATYEVSGGVKTCLFVTMTNEIKPLSRIEKLQLIEEISKMLREEESSAKYFISDAKYPVFTPFNQVKAAGQLQQFLENQKQ